MTDYDTLKVSKADGTVLVTIDRPEVRNALSRVVLADLVAVLDEARADPEVNAVVFTGSGDRAFVAGADINQLQKHDLRTGLDSAMQRVFSEIEDFPKTTIAAVNGFALGGGCELAMACDIRIASSDATFGLPELGLSILPGAGGTQRLARLVGEGRALEMILTGRTIGADEAHAIGLVTSVVPMDELVEHALLTASRIARKGPVAVRLAKTVVRAGVDIDRHTGLLIERLAQSLMYTTDDKREGTEAFLAKRRPNFKGQ